MVGKIEFELFLHDPGQLSERRSHELFNLDFEVGSSRSKTKMYRLCASK